MKNWIEAFRLRTLPLALASIGLGSFLAVKNGGYRWEVFTLCALTTIFLQILSNLANDYGDTQNGADNVEREGPSRAVQTGAITKEAMFRAMIIFVILSLVSGLSLLFITFGLVQLLKISLFFGLGIVSIIAAIKYTAGKNPYGYAGLGDISVLAFFGLVGVLGTYYLHTQSFEWNLLLPALSCGLFSVGVLNVNNIRDIDSDEIAGKRSIPVRLGKKKARLYHWTILIFGMLTTLIYIILYYESIYDLLVISSFPLIVYNGVSVYQKQTAQELDPYLKQMALSTLAFVLTFGIGIIL
ncbi:MAG: 1,4-dihydroxy-2-naphthoate polyprenyltransferase [Cytophagales bacterium]|nr:1,4-dihydroxy-2-naphthoate polyprenyltransferase [Cytophagales bacterium]